MNRGNFLNSLPPLVWFYLFFFLFPTVFSQNAYCEEKAVIKTGDLFPQIALKVPADPKDVAYLGISGEKPFFVSDVKADLLLVEIMNINCGSCQRQAPIYNKLYDLIESTPETKGRIKMIAIATGSEDKYIKEYRDYFKAHYPIFADPALHVYSAIGKSPVPLAIYLHPRLGGKGGVVAGTHEGLYEDYEGMFREMKYFMEMDLAEILNVGSEVEGSVMTVKPIMSEKEIEAKIQSAFNLKGNPKDPIERIDIEGQGSVYTAKIVKNDSEERLFAKVVSQPPPCDECHDIHFIYIFDETGNIRQFIPLQLTKYDNENWNIKDIEKMRGKVVGKTIESPFYFDEKVDAVSSATITSMVIFRNLEEGKKLFSALKAKGLVK